MGHDRPTVGFIGLGLMGRPMAGHLAAAGYPLVVHNRTPAKAQAMAGAGVTVAHTPADVARAADIVIVMVVDTPAAEAVIAGPQGLIDGIKADALVIDMGTTAVGATRALGAKVGAAGGRYVDAPVSGGEVGAQQASLSIMAGGGDADLARAMPLFQAMGRRVTHVGGVGAGQVAKTTNQMIVGLTIAAVSEGLALARAAGVDAGQVREALMGGFADSRVLELHGKRMIDGDFTPGGKATTQLKDMTQAVDLAAELGIALPSLALNKSLYEKLIDRGDGALDHSALIRLFDKTAAEAPKPGDD